MNFMNISQTVQVAAIRIAISFGIESLDLHSVFRVSIFRGSPFGGGASEFMDEPYPAETTLCLEKNTHSRFLLYLRGKCSDLHKIFRACLWGIRYSTNI